MYQLINDIITEFRKCFKNIKTWQWFVILIIGFMIRDGIRGVTMVVSSLKINPDLYQTMMHYFRSKAYKLGNIYKKWVEIAQKRGNLVRIGGRILFLGDHLKMPKEGKQMPGV